MNDRTDIFEPITAAASGAVGSTVHSNTHNHALVENPFAWENESESAE